MDSSKSLLNPYATPFVPFSKTAVTTEAGNLGKLPCAGTLGEGQSPPTFSNTVSTVHPPSSGVRLSISTLAGCTAQALNSGKIAVEYPPQDMEEKFDLVSDMLCNAYPEFSKESIGEVFYTNGCDLEGTFNMLDDMENLTGDTEAPCCGPNTSGTGGAKDNA